LEEADVRLKEAGVLKGRGFSRANENHKMIGALAPEGMPAWNLT
jgi:hypothetical protein